MRGDNKFICKTVYLNEENGVRLLSFRLFFKIPIYKNIFCLIYLFFNIKTYKVEKSWIILLEIGKYADKFNYFDLEHEHEFRNYKFYFTMYKRVIFSYINI